MKNQGKSLKKLGHMKILNIRKTLFSSARLIGTIFNSRNSWKIRLIPLLITVTAYSPLYAGGGESYSSFYSNNGYNILHKELVKMYLPRSASLNPSNFSGDEWDEKRIVFKYNLNAWGKFLNTSSNASGTTKVIVYDRNEALLKAQPDSVRTYLALVAKQEPIAGSSVNHWLEKDKQQLQREKRQATAKSIIEEIRHQLATEKDPFLRQRYAYLLIRLEHHTGDYEQVLIDYDKYASEVETPDKEVAIWITMLKAGAMQHLGKRAEAAYLFATLFIPTKTKKFQTQINFKIKTDEEWKALLALCKDDDEKALMHFMRAIRTNANSLQELENIYALAPDSDWFDSLLIRELEFVQFAKHNTDGFSSTWWSQTANLNKVILIDDVNRYEIQNPNKMTAVMRKRRTDYLQQLTKFVTKVMADKKRKDLFLTEYASLYLKLLTAQAVTVEDILDFQKRYENDSRIPYTRGLELLAYLENLQEIDAKAEDQISGYITAIEALDLDDNKPAYNSDIMTYIYIKLEPLYKRSKEIGKHYIARHRGQISEDDILVGEIRDLLELQKKTVRPNVLIRRIVNAFNSDSSPEEMIVRKYLEAGLLSQAKQLLKASKKQHYIIGVMTSEDYEKAKQVADKFIKAGFVAKIGSKRPYDQDWQYHVWLGFYDDQKTAKKVLKKVNSSKALDGYNRDLSKDNKHAYVSKSGVLLIEYNTYYNPFTTGLSGNNRVKSTSRSREEVIDILIKLKQAIKDNPDDAQSYFLLATAYYNMTWFGNSPRLVRAYRSPYTWKNGNIDLSKAKKHYQKAIKYTKDRELKAKSLYALAKIEENELIIGKGLKGGWASYAYAYDSYSKRVAEFKKSGLGKYLKQLPDYKDTQYFKDVIKQCAGYRYYFAE